MKHNDLKTYLLNNLFVNGKYNSGRIKKFITDEIKTTIFNYTSNCNGDSFSERIYWIINDLTDYPKKCLQCENPITYWRSISEPYETVFCSKKCKSVSPITKEKVKNTNLEKYGDEWNITSKSSQEKRKSTNLKKYGVENYFQSDHFKNSIEDILIEKYNVNNISKSENIKNKKKQTYMDRFGYDNPTKNPEIRSKINDTNIIRYGCSNPLVSEKLKPVIKTTLKEKYGSNHPKQIHLSDDQLNILHNKQLFIEYWNSMPRSDFLSFLGISYSELCKKEIEYGIRNKQQSGLEAQISTLLDQLKIEYLSNNRSIVSPYELDFYLPKLKLAIEANGLYWHGEINNQNRLYHLNKTLKCIDNDIHLIQIWENEINHQWPIVTSRIRSHLNLNKKVMARKCSIQQLSKEEERQFFNKTHIQGHINSKQCYGLFCDGFLMAAMSFKASRFNKQFDYEILRYSSDLNTNVVGGASKLFNYFIKTHNPNSIITYADRRWGEGKFYESLGFTFSHSSTPNYFYFKDRDKLLSRINFQKHKLKDKLEFYNDSLSEWENMKANGWDRIWDCGNNVYHWFK